MAGPIASRERLEELGLNPAEHGSCSEPDQRSVKNVGKVWYNRGCDEWHRCPWKSGTDYIDPQNENDVNPRPRNVAYKFIKPNPKGTGDLVINSWCSCFQFLGNKKPRDGLNQVLTEVVGGEGANVLLKVSEKVPQPDGTVYYKPVKKPAAVPSFPDPTKVEELFEAIYAAEDKLNSRQKRVQEERDRRLGRSAAIEGVATIATGSRSAAGKAE